VQRGSLALAPVVEGKMVEFRSHAIRANAGKARSSS
jgi:hypothetical protein